MNKLIKKYKWLKSRGSSLVRDSDVSLSSVPNKSELKEFIKDSMLENGRCLQIHSDYYIDGSGATDLNESQCKEIMAMLHDLCVEFQPWQFRFVIQEDSGFELSWTEVDEWLHKYK